MISTCLFHLVTAFSFYILSFKIFHNTIEMLMTISNIFTRRVNSNYCIFSFFNLIFVIDSEFFDTLYILVETISMIIKQNNENFYNFKSVWFNCSSEVVYVHNIILFVFRIFFEKFYFLLNYRYYLNKKIDNDQKLLFKISHLWLLSG